MTTPFTSYSFAATGSPTKRTLPARYNDTLNALEWGVDPTGVTDSHDALQACIDYAYYNIPTTTLSPFEHGTIIRLPAGLITISKGGTTPLRLNVPPGYQAAGFLGSAAVSLVGAGRDRTILKGSFSTGEKPGLVSNPGFLLRNLFIENANITPARLVSDMTIWNTSTDPLSGALYYGQGQNYNYVHDLRLKGMIGLYYQNIFGGDVRGCAAEPPAGGTPAGSIGYWVGQGCLFSCTANNLDFGYCLAGTDHATGNTTSVQGNIATDCNVGYALGHSPAFNQVDGENAQGTIMFSNVSDTCGVGVSLYNSVIASAVCSHVFKGAQGVGLQVPQCATCVFMGNVFLGTYSNKAIIMYDFTRGTPSGFDKSTMACMDAPSWTYAVSPDGGTPNAGGMEFIQCTGLDGAGLPPNGWLKVAGLPPAWEGTERRIINAQAAAFAAIAAGGGSNHFKLRADGSNWRRIG